MFFEIFVQVIGFLGIAINLIAVQFNTHGKIVALKTAGSFMFGLQYFLLGAYTGVVMEFIGWIRNLTFIYLVKKNKPTKWWIVFFSFITVILGVSTILLTWESSIKSVAWLTADFKVATILTVGISIISIVAKVLSTVAYGVSDPHKIRMLNYPTSSCWFVYNFVAFSLAGMINEVMTIISLTIAEIRYSKKRKNIPPTLNIQQNTEQIKFEDVSKDNA